MLVAPLASALELTAPVNPTSGGTVTIAWTTAAGDPYVNRTLTPFPLLTLPIATPGRLN